MSKWQIICPLIAILIAASIVGLLHGRNHRKVSPHHTFALSEPHRFLTEELALARARETLGRDGYDISVWHPSRDGRTTAPDGRIDEFMARNAVTPNRGVIMFTSVISSPRLVSVELDGSRVVCETSIAK